MWTFPLFPDPWKGIILTLEKTFRLERNRDSGSEEHDWVSVTGNPRQIEGSVREGGTEGVVNTIPGDGLTPEGNGPPGVTGRPVVFRQPTVGVSRGPPNRVPRRSLGPFKPLTRLFLSCTTVETSVPWLLPRRWKVTRTSGPMWLMSPWTCVPLDCGRRLRRTVREVILRRLPVVFKTFGPTWGRRSSTSDSEESVSDPVVPYQSLEAKRDTNAYRSTRKGLGDSKDNFFFFFSLGFYFFRNKVPTVGLARWISPEYLCLRLLLPSRVGLTVLETPRGGRKKTRRLSRV